MAVSAVGSTLSFAALRRLLLATAAVVVLLFYLYGPAVMPATREAAFARCNDYAQGNFRSLRLAWQVSAHPHWSCGDASRPTKDAVSLGWWTDPFH